MKAPLSWLRDYVEVDIDVEELASRLALSGTEVERVTEVGVPGNTKNLSCFVVGKVLQCERHPNADKLSVCQVDVGDGGVATIVCGAPNVAGGQTVPVVLPGGTLPGGMQIKKAKLRGVESAGMIMSEAELGLAAKSAGIMVLPQDWPAGGLLAEHIPIADQVLEVEVTPNRPDCLSIRGLAREVAAITGQPLKDPKIPVFEPSDKDASDDITIEVLDQDLCPRYAGRVIRGVTIGESPAWLKARLCFAGMRPVNNAVDITNYVQWALGQPLHAFDLNTIAGAKIIVRRARPGEHLTTLDGQDRALSEEMLVIADAERASVVAGIMGGIDSEITESTTDILLECANFNAPSIMRTSATLGLRSESSTRYEKGLDPEAIDAAMDMTCGMLAELCGGKVSKGTVDVRTPARPSRVLTLRQTRIEKVLGAPVARDRTRGILVNLGCSVAEVGEQYEVTVPGNRGDLEREIDLIEEVARINGLDGIPERLPARTSGSGGLSARQKCLRRTEDILQGLGLLQAISYSFVDTRWPDTLRLASSDERRTALPITNPLSSDQAVMRTMLLPSLLEAARTNVSVKEENISLFEIGRVYRPSERLLPDEPLHVGIVTAGSWSEQSWSSPGETTGFFLLKGIIERLAEGLRSDLRYGPSAEPFLHPGKSATVTGASGTNIGWLGELHPLVVRHFALKEPVAVAELELDRLIESAESLVRFKDILAHPAVEQDLALVVDASVSAAAVLDCVRQAGGELLDEARVFDLYEGTQVGEGKKSLAIRLRFRAADRTLSEDEINAIRPQMLEQLAAETGAELRT